MEADVPDGLPSRHNQDIQIAQNSHQPMHIDQYSHVGIYGISHITTKIYVSTAKVRCPPTRRGVAHNHTTVHKPQPWSTAAAQRTVHRVAPTKTSNETTDPDKAYIQTLNHSGSYSPIATQQ
eukprot:1875033-Amphidinium_carterae.3